MQGGGGGTGMAGIKMTSENHGSRKINRAAASFSCSVFALPAAVFIYLLLSY